MKFEKVKDLDNDKFRSLTGVKRSTFEQMTWILEISHKTKKARGGRFNKLRVEDMLLMTLEYLRENRTYFPISQSYHVSESTADKTIRWVEDSVIKHPLFAQPGRKERVKSDREQEVFLMDATEAPIERPKKNKSIFTQGRKKGIR